MSLPKKKPRRWLICLALASLLLRPEIAEAAESCLPPPTTDAQCLECHQSTVTEGLSKPHVHQPFREKQCMLCHLGGDLFTPEKSAYKSDLRISWLTESSLLSSEHWFPLPKNQVTGDIHLDILMPQKGVYRGIIEYQALTNLPEMARDRTPPVLSNVKVAGIERGVLLTATISWLTDELADTRIAYGSDKLDTSNYIAEMSRMHQITIPLKDAARYQFQVGSADYLGNLAQAQIATFSTSAFTKPAVLESVAHSKEEPTWDHEIYQDSQAGLIILKVTTTVPTEVAVGTPKEIEQKKSAGLTQSTRKKPCRHRLKSALETTITVCQPCHETYFKGATLHPLQVGPKAGMVFPPELFVLANGGINCVTCHAVHGSDFPNLLVKSDKQELCISCHTNK